MLSWYKFPNENLFTYPCLFYKLHSRLKEEQKKGNHLFLKTNYGKSQFTATLEVTIHGEKIAILSTCSSI